jgi:hypothetical protein
VFHKVATKYKLGGEFTSAHIMHVFQKLVIELGNKELVSRVKPMYIKQSILWVGVQGSTAAQKLQLSQHILLEKLQAIFGEPTIRQIRITQSFERSGSDEF